MIKDFYTIKEFAEKLGFCEKTIRICIKTGRLNAFKIGGKARSQYRIPHTEIERIAIMEFLGDFNE